MGENWYHGSNRRFSLLRKGSTVTPWRELAEAFSHKPTLLSIDDARQIRHNGRKSGYLYRIDEPVEWGVDVYPHPNSSMEAGLEYLTGRPLRVRLLAVTGAPEEMW